MATALVNFCAYATSQDLHLTDEDTPAQTSGVAKAATGAVAPVAATWTGEADVGEEIDPRLSDTAIEGKVIGMVGVDEGATTLAVEGATTLAVEVAVDLFVRTEA